MKTIHDVKRRAKQIASVISTPRLYGIILLWGAYFTPSSTIAQEELLRWQQAFARIDQFVAQQMQEAKTPGLALALTTRDGLLRVQSYGFADLKSRNPVKNKTLFEIGSISKSFTAIALLQFYERGKLDLKAPIKNYLPWFEIHTKYEPITPHHLLSHTAGIPADRDDIPSSVFQAVGIRERWTGYAPGTKFAYSNIGYQILGYLVEALAQRPYAEVIHENIFLPLRMMDSEAAITHETRKRLAVGYTRLYDDRPTSPSQPLVEATWLEYGAGDGSIAATAADLSAYLRMLLNRGKGPNSQILSEKSFELLIQPAIQLRDSSYYGYGIRSRQVAGHTIIGHTGGMVGYSSAMLGDMNDGLGVVVFVNGPGRPRRVAQFALQLMRATLHDQALPSISEGQPSNRIKEGENYAGTYTSTEGKKLTFLWENGKLYLKYMGNKIMFTPRGQDLFWVDHPDFALFLLKFGRDQESNRVVEVTYGPDWYTNKDYSGPRHFQFPKEWPAYAGHYRTQNPWYPNFRIILRKDKLWLVPPSGYETVLIELAPGLFQIGEEETAERLRLDTVINGKALRANLSGVDYYQTFTP